MKIRDTKSSYGIVTRSLHWLLAIGITLMLCFGFLMSYLPSGALSKTVYNVHKLVGLALLGLIILFMFWQFFNPRPKFPTNMPLWEQQVARLVHFLLMAFFLIMPLSGWIFTSAAHHAPHFFGHTLSMPGISASVEVSSAFNNIHVKLAVIVACLLGLHILAALKHHFWDHDGILKRMM